MTTENQNPEQTGINNLPTFEMPEPAVEQPTTTEPAPTEEPKKEDPPTKEEAATIKSALEAAGAEVEVK